jgi:hypothetical protein
VPVIARALEAIHWHKPDRRPPHRPANAFVIAPIILVALLGFT